MAGASIASLRVLADTYGTTLRKLLGVEREEGKRLVRAGGRRVLPLMTPGVKIEQLVEGSRMMDCELVTVSPGAGSGGTYTHEHGGEEFIFVLRGRLDVAIDGIDHYELRAGDSLCFKSSSSYSWENPGRQEAVVIWINTPPTF